MNNIFSDNLFVSIKNFFLLFSHFSKLCGNGRKANTINRTFASLFVKEWEKRSSEFFVRFTMMFFNASAIKDELWWSWDKTWRLYHLHDMYNMICCLLMAPIISTWLCIYSTWQFIEIVNFILVFFLLFHGTFRAARCLLTIENLSLLSLFYLSSSVLRTWISISARRSLCLFKKKAWELFLPSKQSTNSMTYKDRMIWQKKNICKYCFNWTFGFNIVMIYCTSSGVYKFEFNCLFLCSFVALL